MKIFQATDKSFAYIEQESLKSENPRMPEHGALHVFPRRSIMSGVSVRLEEQDIQSLPDNLKSKLTDGNILKYE